MTPPFKETQFLDLESKQISMLKKRRGHWIIEYIEFVYFLKTTYVYQNHVHRAHLTVKACLLTSEQ